MNEEIEAAIKSGKRPRIIACWPGMMKRATAAAYCDMSIPSFEKEIAVGRVPPGVMFGGTLHWHKGALDKALARLVGEDDGEDDLMKELRERYGKAAPSDGITKSSGKARAR